MKLFEFWKALDALSAREATRTRRGTSTKGKQICRGTQVETSETSSRPVHCTLSWKARVVIDSIFFDRANKFHRKLVYRVLFSRSIPLSCLSLSLETLLSCVLEKGFYDDEEFLSTLPVYFTQLFICYSFTRVPQLSRVCPVVIWQHAYRPIDSYLGYN